MKLYLMPEWLMKFNSHVDEASRQVLEKLVKELYCRILFFEKLDGVELYLLDLASGMHFGTFKSFIGILTAIRVLENGYRRIAFVSSGNTGNNLLGYLNGFDIESFYFLPARSLYKVNPRFYDPRLNRIFAVEGDDVGVKRIAKKFADRHSIPYVPDFDTQIESNKARAYVIHQYCREKKMAFDWLTQALSAGYGPIGTYYGFEDLKKKENARLSVPRFLGIQQENARPFSLALDAFCFRRDALEPTLDFERELLAPTLYNTSPGACVDEMRNILTEYGGGILVVNDREYLGLEREVIAKLESVGLSITSKTVGDKKLVLENAGLYSIVGAILAVRDGIVKKGETVLVSFTGGVERQDDRVVSPTDYKQRDEPEDVFLNRIAATTLEDTL